MHGVGCESAKKHGVLVRLQLVCGREGEADVAAFAGSIGNPAFVQLTRYNTQVDAPQVRVPPSVYLVLADFQGSLNHGCGPVPAAPRYLVGPEIRLQHLNIERKNQILA